MSEEELEAKMKKILEDYAPILNAKVVDALPEELVNLRYLLHTRSRKNRSSQKK